MASCQVVPSVFLHGEKIHQVSVADRGIAVKQSSTGHDMRKNLY